MYLKIINKMKKITLNGYIENEEEKNIILGIVKDEDLNSLMSKICKELQNKIEMCFIEGLKLKGFTFENRLDLEEFIRTRCKKVDNPLLQEHIYYIDDIPFFLHNYELVGSLNILEKNSINFGSYSYL